MKCQKMKKYLYRGLSVFIALYFSLCSCIGSYASSSTSSGVVERTEYYVQKTFDALCRYTVKGFAVISDSIVGTWDNFLSWIEDNGHSDIWEQHPHTPIRIENGVEYADVPEEVLEVIQEYVIYNIQNYDLGYVETYIYSYNFMSPSSFPTYSMYKSAQQYAKNSNGYVVTMFNYNSTQLMMSRYLTKDKDLGFVGTVNNAGGWTSVQPYINWASIGNGIGTPSITMQQNGSTSDTGGNVNWGSWTLNNTSSVNTAKTIFSNNEKNELVFVFKTLNALKNYNSGRPQGYYLTSDGLANNMSDWSVGSGTINTGTLSSVNGSYNTTINNVQSGWTAEQVLALVDRIASSSSGGSGSDDDDDDKSSLWEKIGNAIGNLIDGVVDVIAAVIEKLTDAILSIIHQLIGYTDEQGVVHEGLLGKLTSLISVDFNNFLQSVFSWLPPEIVTIFTATLIFAIFFAIWKMIRG